VEHSNAPIFKLLAWVSTSPMMEASPVETFPLPVFSSAVLFPVTASTSARLSMSALLSIFMSVSLFIDVSESFVESDPVLVLEEFTKPPSLVGSLVELVPTTEVVFSSPGGFGELGSSGESGEPGKDISAWTKVTGTAIGYKAKIRLKIIVINFLFAFTNPILCFYIWQFSILQVTPFKNLKSFTYILAPRPALTGRSNGWPRIRLSLV